MPTDHPDLSDLPTPAELHATFAAEHPLDWGDPLPTTQDLISKYGALATRRALQELQTVDATDRKANRDLAAALGPGQVLYQLENRIKSPYSLARKIKNLTGQKHQPPVIEDVQRYTVLIGDHDQLVDLARQVTDEILARGWTIHGVRNSYVDGSRYKGLRLDTREPGGRRIEVQLHSSASIAVKEATTRPYEIERDRRNSRAVRFKARYECIQLSAELKTPRGLDQLTDLGGCTVTVRGYGLGRANGKRDTSPRQTSGEQAAVDQGFNLKEARER